MIPGLISGKIQLLCSNMTKRALNHNKEPLGHPQEWYEVQGRIREEEYT